MTMMTTRSVTIVAIVGVGLAFAAGYGLSRLALKPKPKPFEPPPISAIDSTPFGRQVAFGRAIFDDPQTYAHNFVGDDMKCSNCHLGEGRVANSAPMWGAYVAYPQYRAKNGHVNTFAERLQGCFEYSENGKAPPAGRPGAGGVGELCVFPGEGRADGREDRGRRVPKTRQAAAAARLCAWSGRLRRQLRPVPRLRRPRPERTRPARVPARLGPQFL